MSIIEIIFLSMNTFICVSATVYFTVNTFKIRAIEKKIIQLVSVAEYNTVKQKFPTHVQKRMQYLINEGILHDSKTAEIFTTRAKNNAIALRFIVATILTVLILKYLGNL